MFIIQRGQYSNVDSPLQEEEMKVLGELIAAGDNGIDYAKSCDVDTGLSLRFLFDRGCIDYKEYKNDRSVGHVMVATPRGKRRFYDQLTGR